jgi:hypothetical protein
MKMAGGDFSSSFFGVIEKKGALSLAVLSI